MIPFSISWHELAIPFIVSSKPAGMVLSVIPAGLVFNYFISYTRIMAMSLLGLTPTLLLVLVLRKYVVQALIAGALKGKRP